MLGHIEIANVVGYYKDREMMLGGIKIEVLLESIEAGKCGWVVRK